MPQPSSTKKTTPSPATNTRRVAPVASSRKATPTAVKGRRTELEGYTKTAAA